MAPKPIVIKITGDASSLEREISDARSKLNQLEQTIDKTSDSHKRLGQASSAAGDGLKSLANEFTSRLGPAGASVQKSVEGIIDRMGGISPVAIGAAGGVAVLAVGMAKLAQVSVNYFVDLGEQTRKLQAASGVTAEFGSVFVDMANDLGVGSDTATSAMARLAKQAETNEVGLNKYGVEVIRTKDGNVDMAATLGSVADAFANTSDPAERAALGSLAFGRSWRDMVPLLAGGSEGLRDASKEAEKLGRVMSQDDVDASFELQQSLVDLNDSFDGMKLQVGGQLVPMLADAAQGITWLNEKIDGLSRGFADLGTAAEAAVKGIPFLGTALAGFEGLGKMVKDTGDKAKTTAGQTDDLTEATDAATESANAQEQQLDLLKAATDRTAQAIQRATQADKDRKQAQDDLTTAVVNSADVELNYERAERTTIKALEEQRVKEGELRTALDEHGVGSNEARVATEALKDQTLNTKDALLSQADQAVKTAEHNAELGGSSLDAGGKAAVQRDFLRQLAQTLEPGSELRSWLDAYIAQLDAIPSAKKTVVTLEKHYVDVGGVVDTGGVALASGGPLKKGQLALVGEEGPELVVPSADGTVIPNGETRALLNGAGGGGSPSGGGGVTINISGVVGDKDAVIRWVHEGLRQYDSARRSTR